MTAYPPLDVYFLADTTGSMGQTIATVKANLATIYQNVLSAASDTQFGAGQFKDEGDVFVFNNDLPIGASSVDLQDAVDAWVANGGGNTLPEAWIYALYQIAVDPSIGFRTGTTKVIVIFSDQTSHDPANGVSFAQAVAALNAASINVLAIDVDRMNLDSQATAIAAATNGLYTKVTDMVNLAAAITTQINKQYTKFISVTADASGCATATVVINEPTVTVESGKDACFSGTVTPNCPRGSAPSTCSARFVDADGVEIAAPVTFDVPGY